MSTDPANFDPHVSTGAASDYLRQLSYNSLLQFDSNGEIVGDLAEEYGFSDPRTYVVRLRPDVQFHDGSTLTADDVVFSVRRMQDEATAASSAPLLAGIVEVVARDPRTVEMRLAEPDVALPYALALPPTLIVSRRWIESGANPKTTVMGTGPFRLVERIPGVATTYEQFDCYFDSELPYLNGIVFQPMGDDYARVTALRAATVDMIDYVLPRTWTSSVEIHSCSSPLTRTSASATSASIWRKSRSTTYASAGRSRCRSTGMRCWTPHFWDTVRRWTVR